MKKSIVLLGLVILFSTGCIRESAEDIVKGYLSESLEDIKGQLPEDLKKLDSLLMDSMSIGDKIGKIANLDSLKKYEKVLLDAESLLKEDISELDSISPQIRNILDLTR